MSGVNIDWSGFAALSQRQAENFQKDTSENIDRAVLNSALSAYRDDPSNTLSADKQANIVEAVKRDARRNAQDSLFQGR